MDIADAVMERPDRIQVGDTPLFLYPVTLGKSYLLQRLTDGLGIDMQNVAVNPYLEALRLCRDKRELVCRIVAYHTIGTKDELFDNTTVDGRCALLSSKLNDEELAQLLVLVLTKNDVARFVKHLGLDREKADFKKVSKAKEHSGRTYSFNGKSVYGTLIDYVCQRYGWTMDYVVWGISYVNLQMLLNDSIATVYLTKDECRGVRVADNRDFINGDDPKNAARIRQLFND